jgi:RimJ/RimL family protein N-acetyltransferase
MEIPNSERLHYRLMTPADKALMYEVDQDEDVMQFINGGNKSSMEDIEDVMLPRLNAYLNPEKGWGLWAVFNIKTQLYLGWILVRPMYFFSETPAFDDLELGWRFKKSAWGHGYATEAAAHIMKHLLLTQDVTTFSAIAVKENVASINIMTKLGMQYVKSAVHHDPLGDMLLEFYSVHIGVKGQKK